MHDVCVQCFQGLAIVQINYALDARLRSRTLWMVIAAADKDATTPVCYICQLQSKDFPRAQATVQHEQDQAAIAEIPGGGQQAFDLMLAHWSGEPLHGFQAQFSDLRLLPRNSCQKRFVAIAHPP
jgi:hypothetical protein